MDNSRLIYALLDPVTGHVRYVGLSTRGMERPNEHLRTPKQKDRTHKTNWLRGLFAKNLKPIIRVVEYCDTDEQLSEAEIGWIEMFRLHGCPLTNHADGGFSGRPDESVRQKMSRTRTGRRRPLHSKRMSGSGNPLFGKHHTAESNAKNSEAHLGRTPWNKGVPHTEEAKARMSASRRAGNARKRAEKARQE